MTSTDLPCPKDPQWLNYSDTDSMSEPMTAEITGEVPGWITGSLYRNGSGVYQIGKDKWKHLFDGFAVIQRWSIDKGKVTLQSTVLDSEQYKKCFKTDRLIGTGFGSTFPDPCKSMFKKVFSYFVPSPPGKSDNTAVNVVEHGDKLFAMTETPVINEVKPDSLTVNKQHNIADHIVVHIGTAHPLKSPDGKTMYYYGTHMNYKQAYNFVKIPISNNKENPFAGAEIVASVPSRWKMNISYTHSFGVTENYFVHFEQPMTFNLPKLMTLSMRGSAISECINCHENEPIHIIAVDMKTGKKVPYTYTAPHGFVFHFANCYEEEGHIIVDVALFDSGAIVKGAYIDEILKVFQPGIKKPMPVARYARFVLPLNLDEAKHGMNLVTLPNTTASAFLKDGTKNVIQLIEDRCFDASWDFELPRINDNYTGLKHRYVYGASALSDKERRLIKFDLQERTVKEWNCKDNQHQTGECVFIPRPGATEEDDGVVVSPVISGNPDFPSYLIILDGKTFKEIARATVPKEQKLTFTFHGFFTEKNLSNL